MSESERYLTHRGVAVPRVGFGTYLMEGEECFRATKQALKVGYRHIDTAMKYGNEEMVGKAIEESNVERDDVFITTKISGPPYVMDREETLEAAKGCLDRLKTDYIDLLLIHWWTIDGDMNGFLGAMNDLQQDGTVRRIGVSNFSIDELQQAISLSDKPIFTNQVEYHPYLLRDELLEFCRNEDILLTAYSPLGRGLVLDNTVLKEIGERYGKSAAQVSIRWLIQQKNVLTIPKSSTPSRIIENYDVFDFELSQREMDRIRKTRGPLRYELTKENGPIPRITGYVGPKLPASVKKHVVPLIYKAANAAGHGSRE